MKSTNSKLEGYAIYAHLTRKSELNIKTLIGVNIRADLKKYFPGVKFSVRTRNAEVVFINWVGAPERKAVESLIAKYEAGYFYAMEDRYIYKPSEFNDLFGEARYIFIQQTPFC